MNEILVDGRHLSTPDPCQSAKSPERSGFVNLLDLIQQVNRLTAIPIQLVDEGEIGVSRNRQTSISLMVRSSTPWRGQ